MNKFKLGDRVKILKTNNNQPIGIVAGITMNFPVNYYMESDPVLNERMYATVAGWAEIFSCSMEEIANEISYMIIFEKPTLNVPLEKLKSLEQFPDNEYEQKEFINKFYVHKTLTIERDIELVSKCVPNYLPESIGNENV